MIHRHKLISFGHDRKVSGKMAMVLNLDVSRIGKLLGDASRVEMISSLIDGRSLTARELAQGAGVSASTASFHLGKLVDAGLLVVFAQGRHHFYRLASDEVGEALQALLRITPSGKAKPAARRKTRICFARTCYGHLAGVLGLAVAEALQAKGLIEAEGEEDFILTAKGARFFARQDIDLEALRSGRRLFRPTVPRLERAQAAPGRGARAGLHRQSHQAEVAAQKKRQPGAAGDKRRSGGPAQVAGYQDRSAGVRILCDRERKGQREGIAWLKDSIRLGSWQPRGRGFSMGVGSASRRGHTLHRAGCLERSGGDCRSGRCRGADPPVFPQHRGRAGSGRWPA